MLCVFTQSDIPSLKDACILSLHHGRVVPHCNGEDERLLDVAGGVVHISHAVVVDQRHVRAVARQQIGHHCQ